MSDLLFVYGTLMRAARHPMHNHVAAHADYVTDATFRGRLYLVHHYPGVVDSDESDDLVFGELYLLRNRAAFADLDDYEGCGPNAPQPAEYVRMQRSMTCADGAVVTAWIYLYNWPIEHLPRIPDGRFMPPHST
jgi:gamma-glutamylcyclotransferase (GGCT)/AIG2-like uncharacterized protein YtfP